jgi:hypothetical protein
MVHGISSCIGRPQLTVTTKLMPGRQRHRDDARIVATLELLPPGPRAEFPVRAGVANDKGVVYRDITVSSTLELLHLVARMNTLGFSVNSELRQTRSARYECVFSKAGDRSGGGSQELLEA